MNKINKILNNIFIVDLKFLLFPILILLFFQFFAVVTSIFTANFNQTIFLSFCLSTLLSLWIVNYLKEKFEIKIWQLLTIIVLTSATCILFLSRISWHIYDYICPTGLLGLVTQVANGIFPVSFLSFPEFIMNYHQGFIFTSGTLAYLLNISPSVSIQITLVGLFAVVNIFIMLFFIYEKNKYFFLPTILFIFISSISTKFYLGMDLDLYNYINILEQNSSNSWPLAFIALITLLFVFKNYTHSVKNIFTVFFILLTTITINATLFSVLLLSLILLFLYKIYYLKRIEYKYLALCLGLFLILIIISRHVPSAFLIGQFYESPEYGIRFFETETFKYFKHIARYLLLSGPIVIVALLLSHEIYKRKLIDKLTVLSSILIVSFIFPIVFIFKNIDMWDNLHKFAIINIFTSILIIVYLFDKQIFNIKIKHLIIACAVLGLPATFDLTTNRLSIDFTSQIYPQEEIRDVVTFLKNQQQKKVLLPYKIDVKEMCSSVSYASVAQYSGSYLKYSYFENFLLAKNIERANLKESRWAENQKTSLEYITNLKPDETLIVSKKHRDEFIKLIHDNKSILPNREIKEFNNYIIY